MMKFSTAAKVISPIPTLKTPNAIKSPKKELGNRKPSFAKGHKTRSISSIGMHFPTLRQINLFPRKKDYGVWQKQLDGPRHSSLGKMVG